MTRRLTGIPRKRLATHGDFNISAVASQRIKNAMRSAGEYAAWDRLSGPQREALEMIAFKIGRILCGDRNHPDHWDDIAGYAQLGRAARSSHVIASEAKQSRRERPRLLRRFAPRNDGTRRRT